MNSWALFTAAFAAVVLQSRLFQKNSPNWYLGCIVPLLYGAAVAWLFVEQDFIRTLQVLLFGAVIPIVLLISAWFRHRAEGPVQNTEQENSEIGQ